MSSCELEGVEGTSPTLGSQASEVYLTTENIDQTFHRLALQDSSRLRSIKKEKKCCRGIQYTNSINYVTKIFIC